MTIQTHFEQGSFRIIVRIIGDSILFFDMNNNLMAPIEGLHFNRNGVIKEFPDLKGDKEWKQKAIQRFVEKIKALPSETERNKFMIKELKDMGYKPMFTQRDGWRPQKVA